MSKFFIQIVLSVLIAVSAALGFKPNLKSELQKTGGFAKALTHEVSQTAFETLKRFKTDTAISAEASVESKVKSDTDLDLNLIPHQASKKTSETTVESSLAAESEVGVQVSPHKVDLDLKHELKNNLDLDLGK